MHPIGRTDKNAIDQIGIEHIAVIGKRQTVVQSPVTLIQTFLRNITNRRDLHIRPVEQIRNVIGRAKRTEADNTNFYFIHINPFPGATSHPHRGRVRASGG